MFLLIFIFINNNIVKKKLLNRSKTCIIKYYINNNYNITVSKLKNFIQKTKKNVFYEYIKICSYTKVCTTFY